MCGWWERGDVAHGCHAHTYLTLPLVLLKLVEVGTFEMIIPLYVVNVKALVYEADFTFTATFSPKVLSHRARDRYLTYDGAWIIH